MLMFVASMVTGMFTYDLLKATFNVVLNTYYRKKRAKRENEMRQKFASLRRKG